MACDGIEATKIVATVGPATSGAGMIRQLFETGVDVFRLNFSHGSHDDHRAHYQAIRDVERALDRPVSVMADLQGPKLRIGTFPDGAVELEPSQPFRLVLDETPGAQQHVCLPHREIFEAARSGIELLLDDGRIRLKVLTVTPTVMETEVMTGGVLSDRKGVNVPGVTLGLSALGDKDRSDLAFALGLGVDWIALSFVQRPDDVAEARRLIAGRAAVLIKLEKPAAIDHLQELIEMADAVMVARGRSRSRTAPGKGSRPAEKDREAVARAR